MSTRAEAARHIDLSERRFGELVDMGVIARADRGGHELDAVRVAYIRHLREMASGRPPAGDLDPAQMRARKDQALAISAEIKNDIASGKVVLTAVAVAGNVIVLAKVRNKLLGLPSRVAPRAAVLRTAAAVQALIYDEAVLLLQELTDGGDGNVSLDEVTDFLEWQAARATIKTPRETEAAN